MFRVKICGITNLDDGMLACELGAEALGFVFWMPSPRSVSPGVAAAIAAAVPPGVARVGVFVDDTPARMAQLAREVGLTHLQLHGSEPPEACEACALPVIKAFGVDETFDIGRLAAYRPAAFLLDARDPAWHGGTGRRIDWMKAREARRYGRVILAGGLSADNVREALATAEPDAIDISTSVEERPGRKSAARLRALMAQVREFQGSGKPPPPEPRPRMRSGETAPGAGGDERA